jgi:stress-induced morphogen
VRWVIARYVRLQRHPASPDIERQSGHATRLHPLDGDLPLTTDTPTRADRLHATLTQAFAPTRLEIQDDSARHAGHAGAQAGGETHYSVVIVSESFQAVSRVVRSRMGHAVLASEFAEGLHALSLTLRAPVEMKV